MKEMSPRSKLKKRLTTVVMHHTSCYKTYTSLQNDFVGESVVGVSSLSSNPKQLPFDCSSDQIGVYILSAIRRHTKETGGDTTLKHEHHLTVF
jgi:hypothetical protein